MTAADQPEKQTVVYKKVGSLEIKADAIMKGTKVDGVYTADPNRDPDAHKFETIGYTEVLTRGLEVMDATGYAGYLGIEYVWIDWEHCNEVDNLSETIRFRDMLRGAMGRVMRNP